MDKENTHSIKKVDIFRINKVLMLTSENIHLNNFMFEPIVDMPMRHLKALLNEVNEYKSK